MSLPTRHWTVLLGNLAAGARAVVPHLLRTGQFPAGVAPDYMTDLLESDAGWARGSILVSPYQAWDTVNVYLSNYDPANAHTYHVLVRKFHSIDGRNV